MSFINKSVTTYVNAKITETGRRLLASGELSFRSFILGDSEIDYRLVDNIDNMKNIMVLSPKDSNPNIKYPIARATGGDIFNTIGQLMPERFVITNSIAQHGFFDITDTTEFKDDLLRGEEPLLLKSNLLNGTNTITFASGLIPEDAEIGDVIMIRAKNSGNTNTLDPTLINPTDTFSHLWYKIVNLTATVITLDRPLPNYSSTETTPKNLYVYIYPGSTSYKIPAIIDNPGDVRIWSMSLVYLDEVLGTDLSQFKGKSTFVSTAFKSVANYLENYSGSNSKKSIGVIHYTNSSETNEYGERIKENSMLITLPTILYHKNNTIGLILRATGEVKLIESDSIDTSLPLNIKYQDLLDTNDDIVGKFFPDLKIIIIDDEEILAAMSYKSNRNWTLPTPELSLIPRNTGESPIMSVNEKLHVTYMFTGTNGNKTSLPCMNYSSIANASNNINFKISNGNLPFLKIGGFTAEKIYLLLQKTPIDGIPLYNGWKSIDVTNLLISQPSDGFLKNVNVEESNITINKTLYDSAVAFNLNTYLPLIPIGNSNVSLNFGEETFFYGTVDCLIESIVYRTLFEINMESAEFNSSINPTYNNGDIWITEIGIYDNYNRQVAIGKLSKPIKKNNTETITIQMGIDF